MPRGFPSRSRPFFRLQRRAGTLPEVRAGARLSEHRLRNGMRVLLAARNGDPVVATALFYGVGARDEAEREAGVSHFLEHMMFKGSARFGKGEVDRVTTLLGGQNNAFTGYDHTAYWFEFASDRWEKALEIEADRMEGLLLEPAEFDAERAVVLEELSMGEDDPWRHLSAPVEAALFPHHPYGRPIIGFRETLEALRVEDMRDFHRRFYHPANAFLVVCGDIRPREALAAVRRAFGGLRSRAEEGGGRAARPSSNRLAGEVRVTTRWDDGAQRLVMAWPTVPAGGDEDWTLDLVLTVLTSGRLSRLHRRLVIQDGLATSVSAANDTRVEGGAFWLFVEASEGVSPAEVERAVDEEIGRLSKERVGAAELRRARALLAGAEAQDGETVSDVAEELGEWGIDVDWRLAFDGGERHARTSAAALKRTAARYLRPDRRVVGWSLPR